MLINFVKLKLFIHLLIIFDVLFALIVVAPLVVTFWCTTWKLYDLYIFPDAPVISGSISFTFGFCGQMVLMFYQDSIQKCLKFEKANCLNFILPKLYALFLAHTFVSCWRGVWSFVDATSTNGVGVVVLNIIQSSMILMILKTFRNVLVPPYFVLTDQRDWSAFRMITLLGKSKADGNFGFLVDCFCTMFVEMLAAFIWHDLWFIVDSILVPDDRFASALWSLMTGYLLALICFAMQSPVGFLCEKNFSKKVFIYDVFTAVCIFSALNIWRGVWSFITYYVGNSKEWNFALNTMAWSFLMILNCTYSLSAKDVLKDAENSGRNCVKFQIKYFQKIFEQREDGSKQKSIETTSAPI